MHQASVPSPLFLISVLGALSQEFRTRCPWELLYAGDPDIIAESVKELTTEKVNSLESQLWKKKIKVNMKKTKVMLSGVNTDLFVDSGVWLCGVCRLDFGSNSLYYSGWKHWVHKKRSDFLAD